MEFKDTQAAYIVGQGLDQDHTIILLVYNTMLLLSVASCAQGHRSLSPPHSDTHRFYSRQYYTIPITYKWRRCIISQEIVAIPNLNFVAFIDNVFPYLNFTQ